jgi:hypothetical protein
MLKEEKQSRNSHNEDNEFNLKNSKVCPYCHSCQIIYRKYKRNHICRNCGEEFNVPIMKQVKDMRGKLPIPPTLRKLAERL